MIASCDEALPRDAQDVPYCVRLECCGVARRVDHTNQSSQFVIHVIDRVGSQLCRAKLLVAALPESVTFWLWLT